MTGNIAITKADARWGGIQENRERESRHTAVAVCAPSIPLRISDSGHGSPCWPSRSSDFESRIARKLTVSGPVLWRRERAGQRERRCQAEADARECGHDGRFRMSQKA